jgi:hypothetical protein
MTTYDVAGFTAPAQALNEMLRANVPLVQKNVFPPPVQQGAIMPRITIKPLTPTEKRRWIGEGYGAPPGRAQVYGYIFRVTVHDRDVKRLQQVADQVMYAVWTHRGYVPTASTLSAVGQFMLLEVKGGSEPKLNEGNQLYEQTINVAGEWYSHT